MTESRRYGFHSLRFRLVMASVVIEAIMLAFLVWNSMRITHDALHESFHNQVDVMVPLISVSLTNPLVQRDFATLDERLGRIVHDKSLVYVEVRDELGQLVSQRGQVPQKKQLDVSFDTPDGIYDQTFDITIAGRVIGRAHYGLNVGLSKETLLTLRTHGIALALVEITLTLILLATLAYLLTRHLRNLAQAAQSIGLGDYTVRVAVTGRDEIADTAHTFNAMAHQIERDIAERKQMAEVMREKEHLLTESQRVAHIGSWSVDLLSGKIIWSDETYRLYGVSRENFILTQKSFLDLIHLDDQVAMQEWIGSCLAGETPGDLTFRITHPDGSIRTLSGRGELIRDDANRPVRMLGTVQDITHRVHVEQALIESEGRLRLALDAAYMGTFDWDVPRGHLTWSRWHEELWGFKRGEFDGSYEAFSQRVHPDDLPGINDEISRCIAAREPFMREFRVVWPDGSTHWISGRGEFTFGADGQPLRMHGVAMEVTTHKRAEAEIERLAYSDTLTGLPNRITLYRRLGQAIQQAQSSGRALAVLLLDLNNFREINDTLGHHNGDKVLIQVAGRLRTALWESDAVARLGGDEFAVLLSRLADKDHVNFVVDKILAALRPEVMIEGVPLDVQTTIGIACYPDHGGDADALLQHADVALYRAKEANLTHLIYTSESDQYHPMQLALMGELRLALQRDELTLHYQPIVDVKSGKTVGVEALVRWQHPSRGLLYPDAFIPAAEKTGLIASLSTWVLANALRQQHRWHRAGIILNVSVNLSVRNLQQPDIVVEIRDMLLSSGVSPECLTLEITESAIMVDREHAKLVLTELHDLGIHFAIDDFGIGQSSLTYLQQLPVDKMKVDKSFVMDFQNPANAAIVRASIDLAHNLGLSVTAEGIEDEAALTALKMLGCDQAQGYYISRPQTVDRLVVWLRESPWGLPQTGI